MAQLQQNCPVCRGSSVSAFCVLDDKTYGRCGTCEATFLAPQHLPSKDDELTQYLLHENDEDDPAYRNFLSRVAEPVLEAIAPHSEGLDFGCGPGPALAAMFREAGHKVALYDPYFHHDTSVLEREYDFVVCSETAEHFHTPAEEFDRFNRLLRPGGMLGIMTCFQTDDARFANWHYRKDPTHVVFYRYCTFAVLAQQRGWSCSNPVKDVVLLRKAP
jgi:hypothetical protein